MDFFIKREDLDYTIYCNIANFAKSRSMKIIGNGFDGKDGEYPMPEDVFKGKCNNNKYIVILCEDITILQLCSTGDYHKKSKLSSLINKVKTPKTIIVNHSNYKIKGLFDTEIISGDRYLRYDWIKISAEKGIQTRLISKEEWEANVLSRNFLILPSELPKLSVYSHEAVWNGYNVGDIVEYTSPSLSSNGITSSIRLVSYEL